MLEFIDTGLSGCFIIRGKRFTDNRGDFLKVYVESEFLKKGLAFHLAEQYFSVSKKNTIRGLHFQTPPHHHDKIVCCVSGRVYDVVVDLRRSSPTFGRHYGLTLAEDSSDMLFVPKGLAHGFYALEDKSIMVYNVSTAYASDHDKGIRWDSCGIDWPLKNPLISVRDQNFPRFKDFQSPFE